MQDEETAELELLERSIVRLKRALAKHVVECTHPGPGECPRSRAMWEALENAVRARRSLLDLHSTWSWRAEVAADVCAGGSRC